MRAFNVDNVIQLCAYLKLDVNPDLIRRNEMDGDAILEKMNKNNNNRWELQACAGMGVSDAFRLQQAAGTIENKHELPPPCNSWHAPHKFSKRFCGDIVFARLFLASRFTLTSLRISNRLFTLS